MEHNEILAEELDTASEINLSLLEESIKSEQENKSLQEENRKLSEQTSFLENSINSVLDALYPSNESEHICKFSINGSCIFYNTIEGVIKSSILKLESLLNETDTESHKELLKSVIENLTFLGDKC